MRIASLDVETTGLDPEKCAITQIAVIVSVNGQEKGRFSSYVRPHEGASISEEALKIQKKTYKEIMAYPLADEVADKLCEFLDSHGTTFYMLGQNVEFDKKFLFFFFTRMMRRNDFTLRFRPKIICTLQMAREVFAGKKSKPENMKLGTLCKWFGINLDNAHDALEDIQATYELYLALKALKPTRIIQESLKMSETEKRMTYLGPRYCTINEDGSIFINNEATKDPVALDYILQEIHEIFSSDH